MRGRAHLYGKALGLQGAGAHVETSLHILPQNQLRPSCCSCSHGHRLTRLRKARALEDAIIDNMEPAFLRNFRYQFYVGCHAEFRRQLCDE